MNIRTYTAADREACIAIFESNTPKYFDPAELEYLKNWLTGKDEARNSYKENKAEHFYVLENDEGVVACGGFYIPEKEQHANMVWGMVRNNLHKNGLGKLLFEYRIRQVQELYPGNGVILDTSQYTYPFFEKMGFKVTGVQKDSYGPGLDRYDMVLEG
jgi:N-acetylglutamate synthase-like GNAT family acetyltransferase